MSRSPARAPPCADSPEPTTPSFRSGPPEDGAGRRPRASRLMAAGPHNRMHESALPPQQPDMSKGPAGDSHSTDTHTHALDLLRDALGATVIATYPNAR